MHTTTIVAPATAPGSALGIIRLSGNDAIEITEKIFRGKRLSEQASHTLHFGRIVEVVPEDTNHGDSDTNDGTHDAMQSGIRRPKSGIVDEVVVSLFRAPYSFTGEDVVEISCHGSPYIMQRILEVCTEAGAMPALEGEFTQRAFLNGKMDLTQAEAVADLIAAQSRAAQQSAMHQLRGGFSGDLKKMREELITFSALIELELDFSQEDVEFADRTQLFSLLERINASTTQLISSFRLGNAVKNGVSVAIIGAPNAGKSTLLNALLNEDRAIVSEIAGTTRDTIEETINIDGILFRFIDTAGIREHTDDVIERKGIERSISAMQQADIVIYLYDISLETLENLNNQRRVLEQSGKPFLLAGNKLDLKGVPFARNRFGDPDDKMLFFSAQNTPDTSNGIKELLVREVLKGQTLDGTIITNTRHLAALQKIAAAIQEIKAGMDADISGELIALDIRRALDYIGGLTGQVVHDRDILGAIFGKFCIGK